MICSLQVLRRVGRLGTFFRESLWVWVHTQLGMLSRQRTLADEMPVRNISRLDTEPGVHDWYAFV